MRLTGGRYGGDMIRYALRCADGHDFESWFRDSAAFDTLDRAGQVLCSVCGSTDVKKTLMAPAVSGTGKNDTAPVLSKPASPAEAALKRLRDHVKANSDYVGREFAAEARRMHDGDTDERSIWGEATLEDAKSLHDDGIEVAPLPFFSRQDD